MFNWKLYQASKLEMEFHMINMMYTELLMRAKTEKTTFSCKDNCTLTKHTRCWTYSALQYFFSPLYFSAEWSLGIPPFGGEVTALQLWCLMLLGIFLMCFKINPLGQQTKKKSQIVAKDAVLKIKTSILWYLQLHQKLIPGTWHP